MQSEVPAEPDADYLRKLLESDALAESLREPFSQLLNATEKRAAAQRLNTLSSDFPEDFDESALRARLEFLGDRAVGDTLGKIYLAVADPAGNTWMVAGKKAAEVVLGNRRPSDLVYQIVEQAVRIGRLSPTSALVEALLMQLDHSPKRSHLAHHEDDAFK